MVGEADAVIELFGSAGTASGVQQLRDRIRGELEQARAELRQESLGLIELDLARGGRRCHVRGIASVGHVVTSTGAARCARSRFSGSWRVLAWRFSM